jgi:superfamily I DNA/RNA helicase
MPPKKEFIWSEYQKAIFKEVAEGSGNLAVIARAGASKTSSIIESIKWLPNKKAKTLCVAFTKHIATELEERINKSYIDVRTLHSISFATVRKCFGSVVIDPAKAQTIIRNTFEQGYKIYEELYSLDKITSLCKSYMIDSPSRIDELMDEFDIIPADLERAEFIKRVVKILRLCKEQKQSVNFDDMIWFSIVYNLPLPKYDYVYVDEMQDLSPAQIHIALSCVKSNGRVFAFGDDRQSIFRFQGADSNAVPNIINRLDAKTLPLPISYRCPKLIVKLAQEIVPDIQYAPSAIDGTISYITEDQLIDSAKIGDFVISRTNAPLIKHCMNFIKHKIPANIRGRDIAANLRSLIKKSKKKELTSFLVWLEKWRDEEIKRLVEKKRNTDSVSDRFECLQMLAENVKTMDELQKNMDDLFAGKDKTNIVVFVSTHRAKGDEADNVYLLRKTYKPAFSTEEANLLYVATTRSRKNLIIVNKW